MGGQVTLAVALLTVVAVACTPASGTDTGVGAAAAVQVREVPCDRDGMEVLVNLSGPSVYVVEVCHGGACEPAEQAGALVARDGSTLQVTCADADRSSGTVRVSWVGG